MDKKPELYSTGGFVKAVNKPSAALRPVTRLILSPKAPYVSLFVTLTDLLYWFRNVVHLSPPLCTLTKPKLVYSNFQ